MSAALFVIDVVMDPKKERCEVLVLIGAVVLMKKSCATPTLRLIHSKS